MLLEGATTTTAIYMEPHDVCSIIHYKYAKHVFGLTLTEMGRTETSAWILLEFMTGVLSCLVLLKVSCFWAPAGVKLQAAWSKPRAVQCWVFGGIGSQDLSCGLRQYSGISEFRS